MSDRGGAWAIRVHENGQPVFQGKGLNYAKRFRAGLLCHCLDDDVPRIRG
jgi:hypothetical protein